MVAKKNAPPNKRALYGSVPQLGGPIGFFLSGSVFLALTTQMPEADFLEWGWRIPFVASALLVLVGLINFLGVVGRLVSVAKFVSWSGPRTLPEAIALHFRSGRWVQADKIGQGSTRDAYLLRVLQWIEEGQAEVL